MTDPGFSGGRGNSESGCANLLLPSATKLLRLCFYICLSFCLQGGYLGRYPPGTRYTPQDQVHPQAGTAPWTRYTPRAGTPPNQVHFQDQVHPQTRYTPWDQVHPLPDQVYPLARYTCQTRYTPQDQVHPCGTRYTPRGPGRPGTHPPPSRQLLLQTVCILQECILVVKKYYRKLDEKERIWTQKRLWCPPIHQCHIRQLLN